MKGIPMTNVPALRNLAVSLLLAASAPPRAAAAVAAPDSLLGMPLLFSEDFESGWDRWEIFDQASFKLTRKDGNTFLQVPQLSSYDPPVRGPYNRVLIRGLEVRDFVIEARVRVTEVGRGHRGGMFFFGYRDPSDFLYAHFAYATSDRSHVFAKVAAAPRFTFYKSRSPGVPWTMGWQTLRMVRRFKQGVLEAYVDDMAKPVLIADDLTFQGNVHLYEEAVAYSGRNVPVTQTDRFEWGRLGIGSFQGIMDYDDVKVWGELKGSPVRAGGAADGEGKIVVRRADRAGKPARSAILPAVLRDGRSYAPDGTLLD